MRLFEMEDKMVKYFHCECCGGGELTDLRKEIYENNGGSYHLAVSDRKSVV